jgi:hypothetical protein
LNVRFTDHALDKMAERSITRQDVETALRRPIGDPGPGAPGKIVIQGYAAGARILNICVPMNDHELVITAYWE